MKRSIFLRGESYPDVLIALNQAESPDELKRLIWERMKQNGCTKESEINFRRHCQVVGFILPDETGKTTPVAKNTDSGSKSRLLFDATRNALRQSRITGDVEARAEREAIENE